MASNRERNRKMTDKVKVKKLFELSHYQAMRINPTLGLTSKIQISYCFFVG